MYCLRYLWSVRNMLSFSLSYYCPRYEVWLFWQQSLYGLLVRLVAFFQHDWQLTISVQDTTIKDPLHVLSEILQIHFEYMQKFLQGKKGE